MNDKSEMIKRVDLIEGDRSCEEGKTKNTSVQADAGLTLTF